MKFLLYLVGWLTYLFGASLRRQPQHDLPMAGQLTEGRSQLSVLTDFDQAVLDSLSAHIAVLDKEGVIIAVNQAWRRFAAWNGGTAEQTGVGANYLAICECSTGEGAAEAPTVAARIRDVIAGRMDHFSLEYACHSPTEQRWFLFNVVPLVGSAEGAVVSHTNITKRKAAEEALWQSEARNRALLGAIPDAILRIHRDGTYLDIKAPRTFDAVRPVNELVGKKQHEVLPAAVADRVTHYNRQALESYRSRLMHKLGVHDLPSLVKFAIQHGVISLD